MVKAAFMGGYEVTYEQLCIQQARMKYHILIRIDRLQQIIGEFNECIYNNYEQENLDIKAATAKEELDIQLRILEVLNQNEVKHGCELMVISDVMNS